MNPVRRLPACGRSILAAIVLLFVTPGTGVEVAWASEPQAFEADVCVFTGGTSGGVVAAVQTTRMGKTVVLVEPGRHLGGMSSGGLCYSDMGNKATVGGLARAFFSQGRCEIRGTERDPARAAPVAERVFDEMAREANVPGFFDRKIASVRRRIRLQRARHRGGRHVPHPRLHRRHL